MVDSLLTELVDCIIDQLDPCNDESTLLNCALVGRAWAHASQRSLFRTIHFKIPNPMHDDSLAHYMEMTDSSAWIFVDRFVDTTDQLIDLLDKNPILASHVLCLELEDFDGIDEASSDDEMDEACTSVAEVVNRLSNVRKISMSCVGWHALSSMLRTALTDRLSTSPVTSLSFDSFTISTTADFASLLNHSVHLKVLEAVDVKFRKESNAHISYTGLSLKLDTLVLSGSEPALLPWFQQQSCAFGFENLQSLNIQLEPPGGYEMADFLLQQAGHSLMKLELDLCCGMRLRSNRSLQNRNLGLGMGMWASFAANNAEMKLGLDVKLKQDMDWLRTETTFENLLGYVPNLKSILLVKFPQKGSYTPVPCILSLFKPYLNSDLESYPLQHIGFGLYVDHSVTVEWDSWSAFDVLLENPKFDSLRTVDIVMGMNNLDTKDQAAAKVAMENLSRSLPFLKRSGKLKIRLPAPDIRKIKQEEWHRDFSHFYLDVHL